MNAAKPSKAELYARLAPLIDQTLEQTLEAARRGGSAEAWRHLERAHVLSQPFAGLHVKVHMRMVGQAWRDRKWRELLGQLPRLLLAGPGSLFGRYPRGNRGTTAVSMFKPEPVTAELSALLTPGKRGDE